VKLENVNERQSGVPGLQARPGMNRNVVSIFERSLDFQQLVRMFGRVFLQKMAFS
jgi:hypothetical protein